MALYLPRKIPSEGLRNGILFPESIVNLRICLAIRSINRQIKIAIFHCIIISTASVIGGAQKTVYGRRVVRVFRERFATDIKNKRGFFEVGPFLISSRGESDETDAVSGPLHEKREERISPGWERGGKKEDPAPAETTSWGYMTLDFNFES